MVKAVLFDRRFQKLNRQGWKVLVNFDAREISGTTEIPERILHHWGKNKSPLGYATLRGLASQEIIKIFSLIKGGVARPCVNRWGDYNGYKLLKRLR